MAFRNVLVVSIVGDSDEPGAALGARLSAGLGRSVFSTNDGNTVADKSVAVDGRKEGFVGT